MLDKLQELLKKENEKQITGHQDMETEEKIRSNPSLADHADVSAQTDQEQMKNDISTLRGTEFKTLETELIPAEPFFSNQEANYYEQHDPARIRQSRSKSARRRAAEKQAQSDQTRKGELQRKLNQLMTQKDPDSLLARSVLSDELGKLNLSIVRQDVTGCMRRQNETKYAQRGSENQKMRKTAQADVDNLVNNLRRDIALEGDTSLLEDTTEYTDAFYFSQLFGEETIKERTLKLQQMKKDTDKYSNEEIAASKTELGKAQDMVLFLKNYGSTYSIRMVQISKAIRAHQLARQQIADEGNSAYNQMMLEILDAKIQGLQKDYDTFLAGLRTGSGSAGTAKGAAHLAIQKELARLRKEMKENDGDERVKKESLDKARDLFRHFTWGTKNGE